jgi:outer membrane protein OmpA-like peptidoglycan-associated protein
MSVKHLFSSSKIHDESHWIPVSDLMTGLMIIFLFISVSYMKYVRIERDKVAVERDKIRQIAVTYNEVKKKLYQSFENEFKDDLNKWDAEIEYGTTLSIRFNNPEVLFDTGQSTLKYKYKEILTEFFPKYLEILEQYKKNIYEVRIEGHTSSEWNWYVSEDESYFNNMKLSQDRTRTVLEFCLSIPNDVIRRNHQWAKSRITANGLSSSRLIYNNSGAENKERSRRVEFRVLTNAEEQIAKIIEGKL